MPPEVNLFLKSKVYYLIEMYWVLSSSIWSVLYIYNTFFIL